MANFLKMVDKLFQQNEITQRWIGDDNDDNHFKPFITIARSPGSGGKPIAKMVSEKLHFEFYDDKLIEEVAKSAKLRTEILERIDEKTRTAIQDLVHNVLNPDYVPETRYIKHLCKVVLSLAQSGKVVLLGRGSNFITPDALGLHVQVTAPYRVCVSRAVQYEKVSYSKAREIIKEVTEDRRGFVQQYFGKDLFNPIYYDLTINTTHFDIEQSAEMIIQAFKTKFG